jgi:hypothetical protein
MISRNLNYFEILKIRQGGGIGVFVKNSIFQKCPKFRIPHNDEMLNKINNISESGDAEFPIFGDSFILTKFWKNEFLLDKVSRCIVLEVSPMLLTNTGFNFQYPSSSS